MATAAGPHDPPRRLVVGISGSSAPQYGIALLGALRGDDSIETHLVISPGGRRTIELETDLTAADVAALADLTYDDADMAASVSSGSFQTLGMVVAPCSMRTLAAIAHGIADTLVSRAADVTLKERRTLVLVTRETPLNLVHLRNMVAVTEAGATVLPPTPGFYHRPASIDDLVDQTVGKVLDQFGIAHQLFRRWETPNPSPDASLRAVEQ